MDNFAVNSESSHIMLIKILHCFTMGELRRLALDIKCYPNYYEEADDLPNPNEDIIPPTNDLSDNEGYYFNKGLYFTKYI
jgi:hypothetical protein